MKQEGAFAEETKKVDPACRDSASNLLHYLSLRQHDIRDLQMDLRNRAVTFTAYRPWEIYNDNAELQGAINLVNSGLFSHGDTELFRPLTNSLMQHDPYLLFADYQPYLECQGAVDHAYRDVNHWARMSILNVARMGKFSSDRSIRDYCEKIWKVAPTPVGT